MSPSKIYEPHDTTAVVNYWLERSDGSLPATNLESLKLLRQHKEVDARRMRIHDIRNNQDEYTLDKNGFQVWNLPEMPAYTLDDEEITANEYPVLVQKIKEMTGATHVTVFSHIVRNALDQATDAEKLDPRGFGKDGPRAPARRPHVDFHLESCPEFFGDKPRLAAFIQTGERWQVLGAWRPLKPIMRDPLVLADAQSVRNSDYVKMPRDYKGKPGANSILKYGSGGEHKWCYLHEQQPNEVWLFKHFDSIRTDGVARQCAHTAINLPGTGYLPPRESVEFRMIVLY